MPTASAEKGRAWAWRDEGNPVVFPDCGALRSGVLLGGRGWPPLELDHATLDNHQIGTDGPRRCHRHAVYHVVVVTAGRGSFLVDDRRVVADAPRLFLMSPDQPHSFARRAGDDTVYSELTFRRADDGAAPPWSRLLETLLGVPLQVPAVTAISAAFAAELRALVARVVEPSLHGHPHLPQLLQGHLATTLIALWRELAAAQAVHPEHDPIAAARSHLEAYPDRPLTLDELAAAVERSPKHLGRAFRQRYGVSPMRYHRELRLERAARLLRSTAHPIKQIADLCGFSEVGYFTRCFRERFAAPPAVFRRRYVSGEVA